MSRVWIDVSDLFDYAGVFKRPSGIQRVVFELGQALTRLTDIGFVRASAGGFVPVRWEAIQSLFATLSQQSDPVIEQPAPASALKRAMRLQWEAWQALAALPVNLRTARPAPPTTGADTRLPMAMRRGDTLLVAGAGWADAQHGARVAAARQQGGIRVALLVHDIIPLRRPEWFDPATVARFQAWIETMLAASDRLLSVSDCTARDVLAYRERRRLSGPSQVTSVRLGDGFGPPVAPQPDPGTRASAPMALYVSTIEARKNHILLVDVWRGLLQRLGPEATPDLVFVGREGALTGDLMRQLRASGFLGGKVSVQHAATDADIAALYRECSFTLFPSLYEGWGLPVAESLAFGAPCLASSSSSIPEVGGDLVRYFDPLDLGDAMRAVEAVLRDPAALGAWRADIAARFRPTPWSRTAEMVLAGLA